MIRLDSRPGLLQGRLVRVEKSAKFRIKSLTTANEKKELALGYALWCLSLVGICGVQRMYLGQFGFGVAMLFTFGFCGVAQVLDLLLLPGAIKQVNENQKSRPEDLKKERIDANQHLPKQSGGTINASRKGTQTTSVKAETMITQTPSQEDDLDQLLQEAVESVGRTKNSKENI